MTDQSFAARFEIGNHPIRECQNTVVQAARLRAGVPECSAPLALAIIRAIHRPLTAEALAMQSQAQAQALMARGRA